MATYRLNDLGKALTWEQWQKSRGCGLSHTASAEASRKTGPQAHWKRNGITLGDIAGASVLADRELARWMHERNGRAALVIKEYP